MLLLANPILDYRFDLASAPQPCGHAGQRLARADIWDTKMTYGMSIWLLSRSAVRRDC